MYEAIQVQRPVDAAVQALRRSVLSGEVKPGGYLPPERILSNILGVNRLTLRSAIARLEAEGLVKARQGDGVRVLDWRREAALDVLVHVPLLEHLDLVSSMLELRRAVAAEAVALACVRAMPGDIVDLEVLTMSQERRPPLPMFLDGDLAFSRRLLEAAQNPAMQFLLNSVEHVYRAHPELPAALYADMDLVVGSYRGILDLVARGNAEVARGVVRQVLEGLDAGAMERLRAAASKAPPR